MVSEHKTNSDDADLKPNICVAETMKQPVVPSAAAAPSNKPRHSWAVDVERAQMGIYDSDSLSSMDLSNDGRKQTPVKIEVKQENIVDEENAVLEFPKSKTAVKQDLKMELDPTPPIVQEREIVLDFIDEQNEQKFERLLQQDKIKTPFKRRHSNSADATRSNSPNDQEQADGTDAGNAGNSSSTRNEKRARNNSCTSSGSSSTYIEEDLATLARRQKQIDYGKNTKAYDNYIAQVPRNKRTRDHPQTPNKYGKYSRRAFDGLIRIWRKQLHYYDPPEDEVENDCCTDSDSE